MTRLVFIVGSSYSGSTLLGMLLGQYKTYFNAGELKAFGRAEFRDESCSCGQTVSECSFWSALLPLTAETTKRPKFVDWISTILGLFIARKPASSNTGGDSKLIEAIAEKTFSAEESATIVDVSKSLWRLNKLLDDPHLTVKTVWIRKSLPASIGSLKKRGRSYWVAAAQALLTDWASRRFLEKQTPNYSTVWYEQLATTPEQTLANLSQQLTDSDQTFDSRKRPHNELHLSTGNDKTKEDLNAGKTIDVRLDPSWLQRLSTTQRNIAIRIAKRLRHPYEVYLDNQ